jgi:hypothetical protein
MLFAALVLATGATAAMAQSAGDNQYQDPLGGNSSGGGSTHQSTTPSQPAQTPAAPAQPAQSSGTHRSASTRSVPLARTGFPAWIPLGGGLVLMAGGVLLLVKTPRRTP